MNTQLLLNPVFVLGLAMIMPIESSAVQAAATSSTSSTTTQTSTSDTQATLTALFAKIDTNSDNYLSLSEVEAWRDSVRVDRFNTLDTDKSTSLSLAEWEAGTPQGISSSMSTEVFSLLDEDKNNALTWTEYSVMEPGKGEIIRHFAEMDSNADLQISLTEFLTKPAGHGPGGPGLGIAPTGTPSSSSTTTTQ